MECQGIIRNGLEEWAIVVLVVEIRPTVCTQSGHT